MKYAQNFFLFSFGIFAIAAQTLTFREFLIVFESDDLGVGIFFATWLFWVALSAWGLYRWQSLAKRLKAEFFALAYIPAFLLQWLLILHARDIAGIAPYSLFPILKMLCWAFALNAPLSLISGGVFFLACQWAESRQSGSVSLVYIWEAAGGVAGGMLSTLLPVMGVTGFDIFLLISFILSCAFLCIGIVFYKSLYRIWLPLVFLFAWLLGASELIGHPLRVRQWSKLFPEEAYMGYFQTAQSEYLYGIHHNSWIAVREGSVCDISSMESLPEESAAQIAALHLCQNPKAQRVLLVGSGLAVARKFLKLPQIQEVAWVHPDTDYLENLQDHLPSKFQIKDRRFTPLKKDVRTVLADRKSCFDIVILDMPGAASALSNRYYTHEFFLLAKKALTKNGIMGISILGGENVISQEIANIGASLWQTLLQVFPNIVIKPGEDTWFLAAQEGVLSHDPAVLVTRFLDIPGEEFYPASALASLYQPEREKNVLEAYRNVSLPENLLLNRDERPLASLYHLLLLVQQSQLPATRFLTSAALAGIKIFVLPILVFLFLRFFYRWKTQGTGKSSFPENFLIFSTGWVSIASMIVLMHLYQTRFGSLYLYVGFVSSVFMAGLSLGALWMRLLEQTKIGKSLYMMPGIALLHALVLMGVFLVPLDSWSFGKFIIAFALCGSMAGGYFPIAATRLSAKGLETGKAASYLEMSDHLGAAAGGFITSLVMLPVLGTHWTMVFLSALLLSNLPEAFFPTRKILQTEKKLSPGKSWGYVLLGIALCIIVMSNFLQNAYIENLPSLSEHQASGLAKGMRMEKNKITLSSGLPCHYFKLYDATGKLEGYVLSSQDFAPEVYGYAGKINLAIRIGTQGNLYGIQVLRSQETPAYFDLLIPWMERLRGKNLLEEKGLSGVDVITGATVSSRALLDSLKISGKEFARSVLGKIPSSPGSLSHDYGTDLSAIYLGISFILAIVMIRKVRRGGRLLLLLASLVLGGFVYNVQFSTTQITSLLSLSWPQIAFHAPFILMAGIPLLVLIFGNIYCGYLCPFGALQEMLDYFLPQSAKPSSSASQIHKASLVRYFVLFFLVSFFFLSLDTYALCSDPLGEIFSRTADSYLLWIAGTVSLAALFYFRFWCRYLCPTGAFLSLIGSAPWSKLLSPSRKWNHCCFYLSEPTRMDCLYCERCIHGCPQEKKAPHGKFSFLLLPLVWIIALVLVLIPLYKISQKLSTKWEISSPPASSPGLGIPRDADIDTIRKMIKENRLSDKEAWFYRKVE